jgi:hypothetical protein
MAVPRVLFVIPGVLAGLLIPALTAAPHKPPPGAVGMISDDFARDVVTIHRDTRITLVNDSRFVHIIGPGRGGRIVSPAPGVPVTGWHQLQTGNVYVTPPWQKLGTFYLTCSVHPDMTIKVIVIP